MQGLCPQGRTVLVTECNYAVLLALREKKATGLDVQSGWRVAVFANSQRPHDRTVRYHEQAPDRHFIKLEHIAVLAFKNYPEQAVVVSVVEFALEVGLRDFVAEQNLLGL